MQIPAVDDTIVAVSSGWQPTPVGIVRLSGPDSFALLKQLGATPVASPRPTWTAARLTLEAELTLPATVFWFSAPHSYTGQDVVEVHTVGCLPLLRELSSRLLELGARRALPGEFTARAFIGGKFDAQQVEGVLALMQGEHEAEIRAGARRSRGAERRLVADLTERITELLTRIEAGIDFVEEEDVTFISSAEVAAALDGLLADLAGAVPETAIELRAHKPHVALVGLPNAGKSTLFNWLIGYERALVSPVLGTTRDVLSAEAELDGLPFVLQDCAGLGGTADELELATHVATEHAAQQADLVLWVHAADTAWNERETQACQCAAPDRRMLVHSKTDLGRGASHDASPVEFADSVAVSATAGEGLARLRTLLATHLSRLHAAGGDRTGQAGLQPVRAALRRARTVAAQPLAESGSPELVSLELRVARELLAVPAHVPLDEEILARVFSQFCVGK